MSHAPAARGRALRFRHLLTPGGWEADRELRVDAAGTIREVVPAPPSGPWDGFAALPGMPNAHSHAFQRALAGFGEEGAGEDTFWTWRRAMYRLARALTPDDLYAVARHAYAEMLAAGYTAVGEFHYLHHGPDGARGPEMGLALLEAAEGVGLPLVLLPSLYQRGGFGEPAEEGQGRFLHRSVEDFLTLLGDLARDGRAARLGVAPHSLRAVPAAALADLLTGAAEVLGEDFPIHIHVAERRAEVEACVAAHGRGPVRLLADTVELDGRWGLVHATHADAEERAIVREAGATVVLCPLTEGYLGDGFFPADEHLRAGGRLAVGSDANVRIDPVEELRFLEFGQRLRTGRRACLATEEGLGAPLWRAAAEGGARVLGLPAGRIEPGRRADLVVLELERSAWAGHGPETLLDALVVGGDRSDVASVYVGGREVARAGEVAGAADTRPGLAAVVRRQRAPGAG